MGVTHDEREITAVHAHIKNRVCDLMCYCMAHPKITRALAPRHRIRNGLRRNNFSFTTATFPCSPGDLPPHSFSVAISRSGVASPAMIPTSPRSPSGQSFLSVSVTDPVKLGTGVQAYISYRVITKISVSRTKEPCPGILNAVGFEEFSLNPRVHTRKVISAATVVRFISSITRTCKGISNYLLCLARRFACCTPQLLKKRRQTKKSRADFEVAPALNRVEPAIHSRDFFSRLQIAENRNFAAIQNPNPRLSFSNDPPLSAANFPTLLFQRWRISPSSVDRRRKNSSSNGADGAEEALTVSGYPGCYTLLIDTTDIPYSIYRTPPRHFQENPFVLPFPLLDPFSSASRKPHPTLDLPHSDPTQQSHSPPSPKAARLVDGHQQPQIQCHFHSRESSLTLPSVGPTSLADTTYFTNIPEYQGQEKIVIRRYSDFVWLRNRLADKFKGIFIPPLPEKSAVVKRATKSNSEMILAELQRVMLDRFDQMTALYGDLRTRVDALEIHPPPSRPRPFILNPRYFSFHVTCSFCPSRSLKPLSLFIFFAWTRNQITRSCLPPEIGKLDVTIVVSPVGLSLLRPLLPIVPAEAFQSTTLPLQITLLHRRSSSLLPSPCNHKSRRQPSKI
ncbi:Sorting nexin 1 [Platanthera zijinensis]|uniref:Sorting nexin 1 n=1 Tax=Platanthera zijinensis TaxID=2320716 RepID=A0AAP0GA80_9ASPA